MQAFSLSNLLLTIVLQLPSVSAIPLLSIPAPSLNPNGLVPLNVTCFSLPPDLPIDMTTVTNKETYRILDSSIALTITRDPNEPIPPDDVAKCIQEVLELAAQEPADAELDRPFRYHNYSSHARFAIARSLYLDDFTWGDVCTIVKGLAAYFDDRKLYFSTNFQIEDDEKGAMGDGLLLRTNAKPKDEGAAGSHSTS